MQMFSIQSGLKYPWLPNGWYIKSHQLAVMVERKRLHNVGKGEDDSGKLSALCSCGNTANWPSHLSKEDLWDLKTTFRATLSMLHGATKYSMQSHSFCKDFLVWSSCFIRSNSAPLVVLPLFEALERGHSTPSSIVMPTASLSYQDCPGFMLLLASFTVKGTCQ